MNEIFQGINNTERVFDWRNTVSDIEQIDNALAEIVQNLAESISVEDVEAEADDFMKTQVENGTRSIERESENRAKMNALINIGAARDLITNDEYIKLRQHILMRVR